VADKIRATCNRAERKRYWSDPKYRARQIADAAARVKKKREALFARILSNAAESARRLKARAVDFAQKGYSGSLIGDNG
jgi:hypothetical protein